MPPSSSGPGHSPLKAKTGVRVPVGAPKKVLVNGELFCFRLLIQKCAPYSDKLSDPAYQLQLNIALHAGSAPANGLPAYLN